MSEYSCAYFSTLRMLNPKESILAKNPAPQHLTQASSRVYKLFPEIMTVADAGLPAENLAEKDFCSSNRLDFLAPPFLLRKKVEKAQYGTS